MAGSLTAPTKGAPEDFGEEAHYVIAGTGDSTEGKIVPGFVPLDPATGKPTSPGTSGGGGSGSDVQYTDGAAVATPTGTQANWNEGGTQRAVSAAHPLPVTDATQGGTADAAVQGDTAGTQSAKLRGLNKLFGTSLDTSASTTIFGTLLKLASAISSGIMKVFTQDLTASGNITGTDGVITLALGSGQGTWAGQVLAAGFTAASTINTEYSKDGGTTWQATTVRTAAGVVNNFIGGAIVQFRGSCSGWTNVRVRANPYHTGDTIAVVLTASVGADIQTNAAQDGTDPVGTNAGTQAGSTTAGVGIRGWLSTLVGLFQLGLANIRTNSKPNTAVLHRNAITAIDKVATAILAASITATAGSGGSLTNVTLFWAIIPANKYGTAGVPASGTYIGSTAMGANTSLKLAYAAVTGGDLFDVFLSIDAAPKLVARITEAQRAAGCTITVASTGTVGATITAGTAGSVTLNVVGTGAQTSAATFAQNNAFLPDTVAGVGYIACSSYSVAHLWIAVAITDLYSAPTVTVIPWLYNDLDGFYQQCQAVTLTPLAGENQSQRPDLTINVDGRSRLLLTYGKMAGNGLAVSSTVQLA